MSQLSTTMTTKTPPTPEPIPEKTAEVLQQTLLAGFVFNVNLLMEQMVANQQALQQILTATTAKSVAEIMDPNTTDPTAIVQNMDAVLKAIDESCSSYVNLIRQLAIETEKAMKLLNN